MNITLTNLSNAAVPYSSSNGAGFAMALEPGASVITDNAEIVVAVAGDKPDLLEQFSEALRGIADALLKIITFWREHASTGYLDQDPQVTVRIVNHGPNALRVILGDNTNDTQVDAGATYDATAPAFVEIRELGV